MRNIIKKMAKTICIIALGLSMIVLTQTDVEAAGQSDMTLTDNGEIMWTSEGSNYSTDGWKYYVKYWTFTVTKNGNSQSVNVYPVADNKTEGGFSTHKQITKTHANGREDYLYTFTVPIETLEKLTGWSLKDGKIEYLANAAIGFHYKKLDGTVVTQKEKVDYYDKDGNLKKRTVSPDTGTYTTEESFYKRAKYYGMSPEGRYTGYYGKHVDIAAFAVTITGDAGYEKDQFTGNVTAPDGTTKTISNSGWVKEGSDVIATGVTKHGYKSNGAEKRYDIKENLTINLYSTPWQHQVIYDTAGGSEAPEGFTKIYTETKYLSSITPTKPGYTFVEWKSSTTGKTYQPGDLYDHAQDGGTDTLVAQWKENTYTFVFDGNGGTGTVSDITVKYSGALKLPANGFVNGECLFLGWDHNSGAIEASYQPNNTIKVANIVKASGLQYKDGAEITIYALWNAAPRIDAEDRYFSLAQAQSGYITMEELFQEVTAYDVEDGAIEIGDNFYIESYDSEIYKNFTIGGFCSETFVAVDSTGYVTKKMIKVHIVDTTTRESSKSSKYNYVRFISLKYLDYPEYDGGFLSNSIWRETDNYNYLKSVLSIQRVNPEIRTISVLGLNYSKEVPGTGEWNAPIAQEWYFTKADIDRVKEYINTHGFGNSKEPDALAGFLEEFKDCRVK